MKKTRLPTFLSSTPSRRRRLRSATLKRHPPGKERSWAGASPAPPRARRAGAAATGSLPSAEPRTEPPAAAQECRDSTAPAGHTHLPDSTSSTAPSRHRRLQMHASFRPGPARPPPSRESAALPPRGTRPLVAMTTGQTGPPGRRCPALSGPPPPHERNLEP